VLKSYIFFSFMCMSVCSGLVDSGSISCGCWSADGTRLILAVGCTLHVSTDAFTYLYLFCCKHHVIGGGLMILVKQELYARPGSYLDVCQQVKYLGI